MLNVNFCKENEVKKSPPNNYYANTKKDDMKTKKSKDRGYFGISVCRAIDIDGYHISVINLDTKKYRSSSVYSPDKSRDIDFEVKKMIGEIVTELMGFKI